MATYRIDVKTLEELPGQLDRIVAEVQAAVRKINDNADLTSEAKNRLVEEERRVARQQVDELRQDALEARDDALRDIDDELRPPEGQPTEQLLTELREQRAWARAVRLLDAGLAWGELVERAGEAGDLIMLRTLQTELPDYLAAATDPGDRAQRTEAHALTEQIREKAEHAMAPHLPDKQKRAVEAKYEVKRYLWPIAESKLVQADRAANGAYSAALQVQVGQLQNDLARERGEEPSDNRQPLRH